MSDVSSLGWSKFFTETVDIHFVLGNHVSIMAEPYVQVLAEQLKACIEKVREQGETRENNYGLWTND